jgi:hypothetical protein
MDNFQALEYLSQNPIEVLFYGNLWPVAAFLCMIADEESLPISAAVRKIAAKHPFKVDQDPSTADSEAAEAEYLQKRAAMIRKLTTEAQTLYVRANEAQVMSRMRDAKQGKGGK